MERMSKEERFQAFVRDAIVSGTTEDRRILVTTYRLPGSAAVICKELRRQLEGATPFVLANVRELMELWVAYESAAELRRSRALHCILELLPQTQPSQAEDMRVKLALIRSSRNRRKAATNVTGGFDLQVIESGGKGGEKELFNGYRSSHVARHLTAVDWKHFESISPDELLLKGWQGKDRHTDAPHLSALADRFDAVSFWVATQILVPESPHLQVKVLATFIKVMKRLVDMHNHQTASQILAALNMAAIQRLKKVWAGLSFKLQEQFDEVDELFSPAGNYAKYRELLRSLEERHSEPVLPYVAVFLRDVVYVFDGNPDTTPDGSLNVEKLQLLSEQVLRLRALQSIPFSFQLKRDLLAAVKDLKGALDEEMLYSISLQRQPPAAGAASLQMPSDEEGESDTAPDDKGAAPPTLREIVSEPMLCNALRRFLTARDFAPSLAFYRDVERYHKASAGIPRARELLASYIATGAPLPVSLPASLVSELQSAVDNKRQTEATAVLLKAQQHVAKQLELDHLPSFLEDSLYQESRVVQEKMRSTGTRAEKSAAILTDEDWVSLFERAKKTKVESGGVLIASGACCSYVFSLLHGKLQVLARPDKASSHTSGKTVVTTVEKKGAIVGEMNILDLGPSDVTVVGKGRAEVNRVAVSDLYEQFLAAPGLGKRYYQYLGRRLAVVLGTAFAEVAKLRKRLVARSPEAADAVRLQAEAMGLPRHTLRARFHCRPASEPMCFCLLSIYRSFIHIRETRFGLHSGRRVKNSAIESVELEDSGAVKLLKIRSTQLWTLAFENGEEAVRAYELLRHAGSGAEEVVESEAEGGGSGIRHPLEMSSSDWRVLASNSDFVMSLGEDDAVMVKGESYRLVCLVLEGSCRVEAVVSGKDSSESVRRTVATIGPGNVFGEMSFLTGSPATASVVADGASRVCVVTYDKLDQLFEQEPVLVLKLYHHLCKFVAFRIESIKGECALFRQALASKSPRAHREGKRKDKRSSKRR